MEFIERRDLRGGSPCWPEATYHRPADALPAMTDILIVGAGVMGAMIADRLTEAGREATLIDRRGPARGSTAGSTALVMWAADVPLSHLAGSIGKDQAVARWRAVHHAATMLRERLSHGDIACDLMDRPELYLDGDLLDAAALRIEAETRQKAGLPCRFLSADAVAERFGIKPRAGIVCDGSYVLDPVKLTHGLLDRACAQGARICHPAEAVAIDHRDDWIDVAIAGNHSVRCRELILATGYERARWFLPAAFGMGSSYAIATRPDTPALWNEDAMIWEASNGYLYARRTIDGRIVAGGGDEDFADAGRRDASIAKKRGLIDAQLCALTGADGLPVDCAWASNFGSSPDGLPAIGRSVIDTRIWLASGFGGNGITFAALAADIISSSMNGDGDDRLAMFNPYRFGSDRP